MKFNKILQLFLILILTISLSTILVSCNKTDEHIHTWGKYIVVDDSTHKRVCKENILHEEINNHRFNDGVEITAPTDINPGSIQYECLDCGYKKIEVIPPTGNHIFDQEIVDEKYLKTHISNNSSIYYKSCECGAYGNDHYIFEHSIIPSEYAEVEYIQGTGKQFIDTGVEYSASINTSVNTSKETFTYNPDIIAENLFNEMQNELTIIPNEYKLISFIGTSGTQYIDTGYSPTNNTRVEMQLTSTESFGYWFGAWDVNYNDKAYCLCNDGKGLYVGWHGRDAGTSEGDLVSNGLHLVCLDKNNVYVDGNLVRSVSNTDFTLNCSLYLFGQNRCGEAFIPSNNNKISCAYCKIYENNILIKHLIPCYEKSTGEIGMYDVVNMEFFTNDGTGSFAKGDDINLLPDGNKNVSILKNRLHSLYGYDIAKVYDYQVYDNQELIKSFVPVIRLSDSVSGLYDLIEGAFYPSSTEVEFDYGRILMHDFDNGKELAKASYKDSGEVVYTCSICGQELHKHISPYSYKITIDESDEYSIKTYKNYDYSSFQIGNILYTRNIKTYNYSKIDNYVMFEVVTQKGIKDITTSDSNIIINNIKDNIYMLKGFTSDTTVSINLEK